MPIDLIYHPDDFYSQSSQNENDELDIRNPLSYESSAPSLNPHLSTTSVDLRMTTIKFDKFAQLLLYDGSRRSKYNKAKNQLPSFNQSKYDSYTISDRENIYKNRGSLSLSPTLPLNSIGKLRTKTINLAKFSKFTTINSYPNIGDIAENLNGADILVSTRPILKSRHNKNADVESVRAKYCDEVAVDDFIEFFENHEQERIECEPYLERERQRQIMTYYSSGESSPSTYDTAFCE